MVLPETDFHKRGNLIFVIVDGRYHNIGNSEPVNKNYLNLCGLTFPLSQGRKISDEERDYIRKNDKEIIKLQEEIEKDIKSGKAISPLRSELALLQDIHFFLTEICTKYTLETVIRPNNRLTDISAIKAIAPFTTSNLFLPEIIKDNCLVVNGRVYNLKRSDRPEFVDLNDASYTIDRSTRTVDDIEKTFHERLTNSVKTFTIASSEVAHKIGQEVSELKDKIEMLKDDLHISKHPYCYELGDIGFDTNIRAVYWLIPPHQNYTSGSGYGEGQSAVSLPFLNGDLTTSAKFAERSDTNSPFNFHSHGNCYGFSFSGKSLEDKMHYLRTCAYVVYNNQRFYQPEDSSSDSNY